MSRPRTPATNVVPFPTDESRHSEARRSDAAPHVMHLSLGDWAEGTAGFTCEEEGFYFRLVRRLYAVGGRLRDDDGRNARRFGVDIRPYQRLKAFLLEEGKIAIVEGHIVNRRVSRDLEAIEAKRAAAAEHGRKGPVVRKARALQGANFGDDQAELFATSGGLRADFGPTLPGSPAEVVESDRQKSSDINDAEIPTPSPTLLREVPPTPKGGATRQSMTQRRPWHRHRSRRDDE